MLALYFCPTCGAANEPDRKHCFACNRLLANADIHTEVHKEFLLHNRYQLNRLLGSGGFSTVYQASDISENGKVVAIKQITLEGMNAEAVIEATDTFNREVLILSALTHPQIPRIYDHFNDQNHWYLVLEYIEGQTLETFLATRKAQEKPLQLDEILTIVLQLCTVLSYLHKCQPPLIYRDLKPGNIMYTPAGKLCLIDFGIARLFRPGQRRDTQPLGSPGYAAPEQYGGAQTTPQTDIYSLGALLYHLLSGQDPSNNSLGQPPSHLSGQLGNENLEALVARMLSPNPVERPASMLAVAWGIQRIRQQQASVSNAKRIWQPPAPQEYTSFGGPQIQLPQVSVVQVPPPFNELGARPARVGFIMGLFNLVLGFIPFWGIIPALVGIVVSCYGLTSLSRKRQAIAGLVMSSVAVVITLASCASVHR